MENESAKFKNFDICILKLNLKSPEGLFRFNSVEFLLH